MDLAARDLRNRFIKTAVSIIVGSLILSLGILGFIFTSGYTLFAISGSSMAPTLHDRDSIIIQKSKILERDQIAILKKPTSWLHESEKETTLVKRVKAIPGDKLTFDGHSFFVNGVSVFNLDTIDYKCSESVIGYEHTLTSKEVFVMGDNANVSLDSRRIFCDGQPEKSYIPYENLIDYGQITLKF